MDERPGLTRRARRIEGVGCSVVMEEQEARRGDVVAAGCS